MSGLSPPDDAIAARKRALRRLVRERARDAPVPDDEPPAAMRDAFDAWCGAQRRGTALLYAALPEEAPTRWLDADLRLRGWRVAYPRIAGLEPPMLEARLALSPDELVPGAFDIPEPPRATCPLVDPAALTLVVVPGRAFDLAGRRLGGGLGFYDRFLPACTTARWVGLALPHQLVDEVPVEPHDVPLHALLADDGLHWFAAA